MSRLAPSRPRLVAAGIGLTALLAALVAAGTFTRLDQFAVSHLMPWLRPRHQSTVTLAGLTVPRVHGPAADVALGLWTYPAAFLPSLVLVVAFARRLPRAEALVWCALWAAGNAVELLGKSTLDRPDLFRDHVHVTAFDGSLPSGHTIRAFVVAGAAAAAWRYGRFAFAWAAGVAIALVVIGAHVPTDVAAGLLICVALAGWAPSGAARERSTAVKSRIAPPNERLPLAQPNGKVS